MTAALPALLTLFTQPGCDTPEPMTRSTAGRPDVLLIAVDTLRADRLSQYGYALPTSDALSLLTDRATRFDDVQSPAPWTLPSVVSLLSGLAPARHQVDRTGAALGPGLETLAETLSGAGWQTAGVSFNPHVSRKAGFHRGFGTFVDFRGAAHTAPDVRGMTAVVRDWLAEDPRRPFFLYLQPMNVHGPYPVPADARAALLGRPPAPGFEYFGPLMRGILDGRIELRDDVTPDFLQSLHEHYDTAVHHTARELGALFASLDEADLWDDALVVLVADHGEEHFEHGGFSHGYSLHREVLRVPLFVKRPGQRDAHVVREPVSLLDVHPTILELVGLPPRLSDGHSLVPLLDRDEPAPSHLHDRALIAQASNPQRVAGRSIRRGRFKLDVIDRRYDGLESAVHLYDLEADPQESRDLSGSEPERVEAMREMLRETIARHERGALPRAGFELDARDREALEAIGYLPPD